MAEIQEYKKSSSACSKIMISTIGEPTVEKKSESKPISSRVKHFLVSVWRKICFAVSNAFAEFCTNGSIHGIRHFYNESWYEKIFFLISICVSIVACALIVQLIRFEWLDKPVILSYDIKSMTVKEIPFPAITICPQAKASHKRFDCVKDNQDFVSNLIADQDLYESIPISHVIC